MEREKIFFLPNCHVPTGYAYVVVVVLLAARELLVRCAVHRACRDKLKHGSFLLSSGPRRTARWRHCSDQDGDLESVDASGWCVIGGWGYRFWSDRWACCVGRSVSCWQVERLLIIAALQTCCACTVHG